MRTKHLLFIALVSLLAATSCKKKDTVKEINSPMPQNTNLMLHLHTNVDSNEVEDYNTIYPIFGTRKISVSLAQLYISNIQIVKADGSIINVNDGAILKVQEVEEYFAGSVPSGSYKSIRFNVGLPAALNATTPLTADTTTLNKPNMWFGTTAQPLGYVFMNFQGKIDTTLAANSSTVQMQPFSYKIGTNARLKSVSLPDKNFSLAANQSYFIHITIDYSKLFSGITLNNSNNLMVNTTADNAGTLAAQVANNIPLMFRYEE